MGTPNVILPGLVAVDDDVTEMGVIVAKLPEASDISKTNWFPAVKDAGVKLKLKV